MIFLSTQQRKKIKKNISVCIQKIVFYSIHTLFTTNETMKYSTILKKNETTHKCPFCHEKKENMLQEGKYFFVVPARAAYTKHHLLIIPKRHVNTLTTLTHAELLEMHKLVDIRAKKLHKKYAEVNLLLRDGLVKNHIIKKSVNHLHFHLLPHVGIHIESPSQQSPENRQRLDEKAYAKTANSYKKAFLS